MDGSPRQEWRPPLEAPAIPAFEVPLGQLRFQWNGGFDHGLWPMAHAHEPCQRPPAWAMGLGPKIALAGAMAQAIFGPIPWAMTYGPWGMSYPIACVLCPPGLS